MKWLKENAKAVGGAITALGTWGATAMADGQIDGVEAFGLCGVAVVFLTVFGATNAPTDKQLRELADAVERGPGNN